MMRLTSDSQPGLHEIGKAMFAMLSTKTREKHPSPF
jgi:hypothetical protein